MSIISGSRIEHWREKWNWHEFGVNVARLGVLFVSLMLYSWFRKTYFQQPADEAYANALEIIDWQRRDVRNLPRSRYEKVIHRIITHRPIQVGTALYKP